MYTQGPRRVPRTLADRRAALASIAIRGLWVALLGLHAYLLWQRIVDSTLFEPMVALRWGASLLTAVVMIRLQRVGVSLFRGRRALVLWLVVLLLHAGSAAAVGSQLEIVADGGLLVAITLWWLALEDFFGKRTRRVGLVLGRGWHRRPAPVRLAFAAASLDPLCPRPPPLA